MSGADHPGDGSPKYEGFERIGASTEQVERIQIAGLLPKCGSVLCVVPPGVAVAAMTNYFSTLLSGRTGVPFGTARYPGDVFVISHSLAESEFLTRSVPLIHQSCGLVRSRGVARRFNWRLPMKYLGPLERLVPGDASAVIIDAGPVSASVDDAIVETAESLLNEFAKRADLLVLIIVESLSGSKDPFARVPGPLRAMRDPLMVCPLKQHHVQPSGDPEFLLFKLGHRSPTSPTVRFVVRPTLDSGVQVDWRAVAWADPRQAFRDAGVDDLRGEYRRAAEIACFLIQQRGAPMTSQELRVLGQFPPYNVASTMMRDCLGMARTAGYLHFDGKTWGLPPPPSLVGRALLSPRETGLFTHMRSE
jgi:hypothetical protein